MLIIQEECYVVKINVHNVVVIIATRNSNSLF